MYESQIVTRNLHWRFFPLSLSLSLSLCAFVAVVTFQYIEYTHKDTN